MRNLASHTIKSIRKPHILGCVAALASVSPLASGQLINEDLKIRSIDGAGGDGFGWCTATDGGLVAAGSPKDDDNDLTSGSAYIFNALTGAQLYKLLPTDGSRADEFGTSIAIDLGVVAVGAFKHTDNGSRSGAAYLFNASTGVQTAELLPLDGESNDNFGNSIDIDSGIVAVGAPFSDDFSFSSGSAYLFDATTGAQLGKLLPNDGANGDFFGWSIAIDNGVVAVGAYGDDDIGSYSGSVYLFNTSGTQITKLLPIGVAAADWFGYAVAIDNGIVAVGAMGDDDNGIDSGSVYLFDASSGVQIAKLLPTDGQTLDRFGHSISIDNGVVVVGAYRADDNGSVSGSAYLFNASTGAQIAKLLPSDGAADEQFGYSVAISSGVVVVGAPNDNPSGSVYLFSVPGGDCPADVNDDTYLDNGDIRDFITLFLAQDLNVDFTNDDVIDNGDIGAFITLFLAGCS